MMPNVLTIDLLRHGETTAGSCFLGSTDVTLSEQGWLQVQSAIDDQVYQYVISSPLKRCVEFAKLFATNNDLPLTVEKDLREIHFGDWEAKTAEDLWQTQKSELKAFWVDPVNNPPSNAEKLSDFKNRVDQSFSDILHKYKDGKILLVTHGGVIRQIVSNILSIDFKSSQKIYLDYAGLTRIECYEGDSSLRFINQPIRR